MRKFLPISKEEIVERGWDQIDFLFVSGDAYVDHPSFDPTNYCRAKGRMVYISIATDK